MADAEGKSLGRATSDSADRVDWIQLRVPAGARLTASVNLYKSWWQPWRGVTRLPPDRGGLGPTAAIPSVTGPHHVGLATE
ncbi:MAG: hypothetical protein R3F43_05770 [bacterium]